MGTSTRWPGPKGGAWVGPNRTLGKVDRQAAGSTPNGTVTADGDALPDDADQAFSDIVVERIGQECYDALSATLRDDPDAYGLQTAVLVTGARLVDTLDELASIGLAALGPLSSDTAEARLVAFAQRFVDRVAGAGSSPANAAVRRTAVLCAKEILKDPHIRSSVEGGDSTSGTRMSSELLCWIYRLFFANVISQFIQATITAKINLLLPWWHIVDPAGKVSEWLTNKIVGILPNPCDEKPQDDGGSVADLARSLLVETVQRTLGLSTGAPGAA